jgi:hypothetical protein
VTGYILLKPCLACNRLAGWDACRACCLAEDAERAVGQPSPELHPLPPLQSRATAHHSPGDVTKADTAEVLRGKPRRPGREADNA